jgi:CBS domain-containing protein
MNGILTKVNKLAPLPPYDAPVAKRLTWVNDSYAQADGADPISDSGMFDMPVTSVMKRRNLLTALPGISVAEAALRMARRNVGAIVLVGNEQLVRRRR